MEHNALTLTWEPDIGPPVSHTHIFAHGVYTLLSVATEIGSSFSFVTSSLAAPGMIVLTGPFAAGVLYMMPCSAAPILPFQVLHVGADITMDQLNSLWGPRFVLSDGATGAVLTVTGASEVAVLADDGGAAFFGFTEDTFLGKTSVVYSEGLSVGDSLEGGGSVTHASMTGEYHFVLDTPIPANVTEVDVHSTGADEFGTLQGRLTGVLLSLDNDPSMKDAVAGLPSAVWALWSRQTQASDASDSVVVVNDIRFVVEDMIIETLQDYKPPGSVEVDSLFRSLSAYGLDLGAWYLGSLQLENFFTKEVFLLSSAGALANGVASLLESVEALRDKRGWESR